MPFILLDTSEVSKLFFDLISESNKEEVRVRWDGEALGGGGIQDVH